MNEHNESKTFSGVYDVTSHVRQTPEENQIDRLETPKYEDLDLKVQLNNDSEVIVEMNGLVYPVDTDDLVLKRKTNSRRKIKKSPFHREQTNCRLWEFIRDLLCNPRYNPDIVTWSNKEEGEFRVVKTKEIAKMWGKKKNNEGMTYEKLSRALRYYYKTKILMPVIGKRLIYQFGPSSYGWK
ncbi:ETS homologous factor-like [Saccostrea echinata]|uniref:ETS homologous factor-like n=1 Tax=Saccostrea echinata TaxID=191078 RepID=UPI002A828BDF|nr:ETS homologous factor-like [Saccostrea echinata]